MTIQRAREIFGDEIIDLSDREITNLINSTGAFCDTILDIVCADTGVLKKVGKETNKSKES